MLDGSRGKQIKICFTQELKDYSSRQLTEAVTGDVL